jgi:hypothetical protein
MITDRNQIRGFAPTRYREVVLTSFQSALQILNYKIRHQLPHVLKQ